MLTDDCHRCMSAKSRAGRQGTADAGFRPSADHSLPPWSGVASRSAWRRADSRAGLEEADAVPAALQTKFSRRQAPSSQTLPSERGFLELAGRDDGIPLREMFIRFRDLVSADMDWADSRKTRFRVRASCAKVATLALTAASTVVLGIPAIPARQPSPCPWSHLSP
jgi:hypothetical protein